MGAGGKIRTVREGKNGGWCILALALLVALSSAVKAHEIKVGDLVIVHPMVEPASKGQAAAEGKVEIRNEGATSDRLLSIVAEFAEEATIEAPLPTEVPARGLVSVPITFRHIKSKISEDEVHSGQLVFERAGTVTIDLMVHTHSH